MAEELLALRLAAAVEALGFSSHERDVVQAIVQTPGATAGELAKRARLHRNQVYRAIHNLLEAGFLQAADERPQRFFLAEAHALGEHFEKALVRNAESAQQIIQAWHRIEGSGPPGACRTIPAGRMAAEMQRFLGRQILAAFDTWPLEYSPLPKAPKEVVLAGRSAHDRARQVDASVPLRYLLASDACLLWEGPSRQPSGHLMESPSAVALLRDHFERVWAASAPR